MWVRELARLSQEEPAVAVVTVTGCQGSTPCAPGTKMFVLTGGRTRGTVGGGALEQLAARDADAVLRTRTPRAHRYTLGATLGQCCGGVVDVFIDFVGAGPTLFLFGGGHVAQAVCRVMEDSGFSIIVIDDRQEWRERLPPWVTSVAEPWDTFVDTHAWDAEHSYVAVMTYRHDVDQAIVEALLDKPLRYLGLIGSRTKWARFESRMRERGLSQDRLARVRCPMGLDVGGKLPTEVAISLAAELLSVRHGKA